MVSFELVKSEDVLEVVKRAGPVQPLDIRAILKRGDSIVIGAALSELSARKLVKVTSVKKGGSPFYYVQGQEPKLAELSRWLNEKDRQTFEMLKEAKIMKDSEQDPLTRVSLRTIKDFSKDVIVGDEQVIYWRYYLVPEDEALHIIRGVPKKEPVKVEVPKEKSVVQEDKKFEVQKEEKIRPEIKEESRQRHQENQVSLPAGTDFLENVDDEFLKRLKRFFRDKEILVRDAKLLRKGSEYEFIIEMVTPMGRAEYFCKAKNKKKSSDGDLSAAYLQAQIKRLPVVYITTGEVAKKAKEKVRTDYKGMILKEI